MIANNDDYDNHQDPNHNADPIYRTFKERYYQATRELESRDAEVKAQLETRNQSVYEIRRRFLDRFDMRESEHKANRAQITQELVHARLDAKAAHLAAKEHCREIPVQYVPGETSEADVLRVPLLGESEAAASLGLRYGVGFKDKQDYLRNIKPILTVICCCVSSLSLGLSLRFLDAKNIMGNPVGIVSALLTGSMVALVLLVSVTNLWKLLGTKMGLGHPKMEVALLSILVVSLTAPFLLGGLYLDARMIILLNAARAAFNPALATPMLVALVVGSLLSGGYVFTLALTGFRESYTTTASHKINDLIESDKVSKQEKLKEKQPFRDAITALSNVMVAEKFVQDREYDLSRLTQDFEREHADRLSSLTQISAGPNQDERQELKTLQDRLRSAKTDLDAYIMSRGGTSNGPSNAN